MTGAKDAQQTRSRIVEAAGSAFYGRGIRSVGVDEIARAAGVTKRTLYYYFGSKDELIAAYLEIRHPQVFSRLVSRITKLDKPLAEQMEAFFEALSNSAHNMDWKGCPFARSAAELAGTPDHPALKIASRHKHEFERWLRERAAASAVRDPEMLARQLMVLLDGQGCSFEERAERILSAHLVGPPAMRSFVSSLTC